MLNIRMDSSGPSEFMTSALLGGANITKLIPDRCRTLFNPMVTDQYYTKMNLQETCSSIKQQQAESENISYYFLVLLLFVFDMKFIWNLLIMNIFLHVVE